MAAAIKCSACGGCGVVDLPASYSHTLKRIGLEWRSTSELLRLHLDGVKRTALINRLRFLEAHKIIEGRKTGLGSGQMEWRYRLGRKP